MADLAIIGAPSSAGAYAPGQEKAPAAFRAHGLIPALREAGRTVVDRGDVAGFRWRPDPEDPSAMNIAAVREVALSVAAEVARAFAKGEDVLVLGGDCTVELGTVAGALRQEGTLGLIYVDVDTDLNTPETADGALDWMGVAHLLGLAGARSELAGLGGTDAMLGADDLLLFAAANMQSGEREAIRTRDIACIGLDEVEADPAAAATRALAWAERFDRVLVHLDIDVLNFALFPIAENTRRDLGLSIDALDQALAILLGAPNLRGLTIAEVNPDHAPDAAATFGRMNAMLARGLGRS